MQFKFLYNLFFISVFTAINSCIHAEYSAYYQLSKEKHEFIQNLLDKAQINEYVNIQGCKNLSDSIACTEILLDHTSTRLSLIINESLFDQLEKEEQKFVILHEASHIKRKHAVKSLKAIQTIAATSLISSILASYYFPSLTKNKPANFIGKIAICGLLTYGLMSTLFIPVCHWARKMEFEADSDALMLSGNLRACCSALEKRNKIINKPELESIYADHPKTAERIARLKEIQKDLDISKK